MDGISKTALGVGSLRALHRLLDTEPWVIDDPVSFALFGDAARYLAQHDPSWAEQPARIQLRAHVLVRSAFAEDRLRAAVARGVRQCVVLGAGYDTLAYRQPAWMHGVRLIEVDAPATQADKRARLERAAIAVPENVAFAAIDFERTSLADGLTAAGFDAGAPAFFSWLGVMVYLTRDAVDAVFRFVAGLPAESEIAFTFTAPGGSAALERRVAEIGEPLLTRLEPAAVEPMLRQLGFGAVTVLSSSVAAQYLGQRSDALRLPPRASIAAAIVTRPASR
jgi:methyltransferase (TIGR00027 family)